MDTDNLDNMTAIILRAEPSTEHPLNSQCHVYFIFFNFLSSVLNICMYMVESYIEKIY